MKASYTVDRKLLDEFVEGLQNGKYKYHQFYDTHDVLAYNLWNMRQHFKFSKKPKQMPLMFFDIEVDAEEGVFPDPPVAKWPINSIATMHSVTRKITLYYIPPKNVPERNWENNIIEYFKKTVSEHPEYKVDNLSFEFKRFKEDKLLLETFWKDIRLAGIISLVGFNSNLFDIPYLINRTKKLFGKDHKYVISEFGIISKYGEQYEIPDYSFIDLLHLYKPQSAGGMALGKALESYRLEDVAQTEIHIGKLEHEESLVELYHKNPVKFFVYNIFDTLLLYLLNKKLTHIDVIRDLSEFANTPLSKGLVGRSLLYQYDKIFEYWKAGLAICSKLYNEEISKVT